MARLDIELFRQHRWANLTLLDACLDLPGAQREATIPGASGSLHRTLWHMASSEEGYLVRVTGEHGPDLLSRRPEAPSIPELRARMAATGTGLIEMVQAVDPGTILRGEWHGEAFEFPAFIPPLQAINHGGEHREQVKLILTSLGIEPPELDVWAWSDAGMP